MKKFLFLFFISSLIILILGCSQPQTQESINMNELNATVIINGKETNSIELIPYQNAEVGVKITNNGKYEMKNVSLKLISGVKNTPKKTNEIIMVPGQTMYFSWSISGISLSSNERITIPASIKVCFDYISKGYSDIVFIPESYTDIPPSSSGNFASDYLSITHDFGVNRIIPNGINEIRGKIILKNIGKGNIDYPDYSSDYNKGMTINKLRSIKINLTAPDAKIVEFNGNSNLENWTKNPGWSLEINKSNEGEFSRTLTLLQANELSLPITINITDTNKYQEQRIERIYTEIEHGYCINTANFNIIMKGQ